MHRFIARSDLPVVDAYLGWVGFVPEEWRTTFQPRSSTWAVDDFHRARAASAGGDLLGRLLQLNLETYLLDDLLPKIDRMSMAHGLEVRSPFLDRELVEFAFRLPTSTEVRGMGGKRVLKRARRPGALGGASPAQEGVRCSSSIGGSRPICAAIWRP